MSEIPLGDDLHVRRRPAALREARLDGFDAREIATVEWVLRHYGEDGEADLLDIPWHLAGPRETIPYSLALVVPASRLVPPGRIPGTSGPVRTVREMSEPAL